MRWMGRVGQHTVGKSSPGETPDRRRKPFSAVRLVAILIAALPLWSASASASPGQRPAQLPSTVSSVAPAATEPLSPFVSFSGEHVALSVDAIATNNSEGAAVNVHKNVAGATVRAAYLFAASTGFSKYVPVNGDVTLDGKSVEWEEAHTISNDINSTNVAANVTALIKEKVDAAPAGDVSITAAEPLQTLSMDGEILAVVLEDPSIKEPRSVTLLYGAQNPAGDTFHVGLAEPADKTKEGFELNLGLGISFGYQPSSPAQFSTIEVNKKLMTSSAGGQDDCAQKYVAEPSFGSCVNGELVTAGGLGDLNDNPPEPAAGPEECSGHFGPAPRCDDELYSLLPFIENGESSLTFQTNNPSSDDNIFFGAFEVRGGAAVIGEGVTLSPTSATNNVGETHTVTATVQDSEGKAIEGETVHFEITSGPNAGTTHEATTNAEGKATFAYTSSIVGTDHIVARFTDTHGTSHESNEVTKTWTEEVTETEEPTTLTTSLSGGGQSGPNITVPEGTSVSDTATLSGVHASKAGGTVTYNVYTDSECTKLQASAGTKTVEGGLVPESDPETFTTPGTYYWTASYSGDKGNKPSSSACGVETETVTEVVKPPTCTTAVGELRVLQEGERQRVTDNVSTDLSRKLQAFNFWWSNGAQHVKLIKLTKASCTVTVTGDKRFRGEGTATLNGELGYTVKFTIGVSKRGANIVYVSIYKGKARVAGFKLAARTGEHIS